MSDDLECALWVPIIDYIVPLIPKILFFIGGPINFCKVRSMAFNRVVQYSKLFKMKLKILYLMIFLNFVMFGYTIIKIIKTS